MVKKITIFIFMLLICAIGVSASKLEISDITAWVDGDKDTMSGGNVDDVKPGSELKIKIEFHNDYTDDEDLKIEDIDVTAVLKDIEDEGSNDIDLDDDIDKIRTDDEDTVTFIFQIPMIVDSGTYILEIEAEGEDENNTKHLVSEEYDVNVEKENHEIRWYSNDLSTTKVCSGLITLNVGVINTGDSEEDVVLTVRNSELELNQEYKFTLDDDPYDSDSKKVQTVNIRIPDGVKEKTYIITSQATYSSRSITNQTELKVECGITTTPTAITTPPSTTIVKTDSASVAVTNDKVKVDTTSTLPATEYVSTSSTSKVVDKGSDTVYIAMFVFFEILIVLGLIFGIIYYKKNK